MDATIAGIVETLGKNRERFLVFCRSLSAEELCRAVPESTWAVRDFIAHLDTLDVPLTVWFEDIAQGAASGAGPGGGAAWDVDLFNEAEVTLRRDWPLDQVLAEAAQNRAKLVPALSALTSEHLQQSLHFPGDAKRKPATIPVGLFLSGWAYHDPMHACDMLRALPERGEDAELRAWVEHPFVRGYQVAMNAAG